MVTYTPGDIDLYLGVKDITLEEAIEFVKEYFGVEITDSLKEKFLVTGLPPIELITSNFIKTHTL